MDRRVEQITLGMGCFWGVEALFGQLPGVVRTETGYAGGTTPEPDYRALGDHSETVQISYDPRQINLERLLEVFWAHHRPSNTNGYKGRQYQSLILYHSSSQLPDIERAVARRTALDGDVPVTEIAQLSRFYPAEERHQKYNLKRYPNAVDKLPRLCEMLGQDRSETIAARLNGLAKGHTSLSRILDELMEWELEEDKRERVIQVLRDMKW
ncbi:peptide-methionine (S)-S-oxide reductase MsrA [Paenibacillus sp. SYP-B4298]|uniref:peptide-methionine (S)-S-oxide reductase MsrA n=1 Tax=Paenibacillus sp. SYP-B4298 TaxID=2996034 RepID=UPI0022DE6DED|nr:peptide-methionine (S)-S-oxide reductase MsrA [Paenibacillus sp. SYP-B4298]